MVIGIVEILTTCLQIPRPATPIRTLASAKARMMQYTIGPVVGSEKSL